MIADEAQARLEQCGTFGRWSRRDFLRGSLGLLAASSVVGGLAGCASANTTLALSTSTPTPPPPRVPSGTITTSNAARITRLATLDPMNHRVRGVAWAPDGRVVASGSYPDVDLWDVATGRRLATLSGHTSQIYSMAWSPANHLLASASSDGTVRVWETQQARALQTLRNVKGGAFFSVAWSPDGQQLVAGTEDGDVVRWHAQTGERIAVWSSPAPRQSRGGSFPFAAWGVTWSPDGRRIVSTRYDDLILVWDIATGRSQAIPKTDTQPNTVLWSPNGRQFAVTDDAGKVILWNGAPVERGATFESQNGDGWAYGLTWSPDGSLVASSRESGVVQVWDARTGKELVALQGHQNAIWGLAWSPDGLRLASASDDGSVYLWGVPAS